MALKATLDSLDDVSEGLREHYEQDGPLYRLRVEGYDDTALRQANERLKTERDKLRQKLDAFGEFDPTELQDLVELREQFEERVKAESQSWDQQRERLEARYQKEQEKLAEKLNSREGQLTRVLKESAAKSALAEHDAIMKAMLPQVLGRVELVPNDDGEFATVAKGLDDEETDIGTLVKQMKESGEFDWGFQSNGRSGGGSPAGTAGGSGKGKVRSKKDLASAAEHSRYIAEHGLEAYRELPRE